MSGRTPLDLGVRFDGRPHRLQVGVRPLDLDSWLLVDSHRADELRMKQRLLLERHDEVVASLPGSDDAGTELLGLVVAALTDHDKPMIAREGAAWIDVETGVRAELTGSHPVSVAAQLVQEDLCILQRSAAGWILTAASVCFPSRWRLQDKIGQTVAVIHEPVPGYGRIARATDQAMDRITAERPMTRSNWTLIDDPALFQSTRHEARGAVTGGGLGGSHSDPIESVYLRIERQTLRLLPETRAMVFTIRTVVRPLATLGERDRGSLAATLLTVDEGTMAYKDWTGRLPAIIGQLAHPR